MSNEVSSAAANTEHPNLIWPAGPAGIAQIAVSGFASAIGLWALWFVTHLPALNLPERSALLILLAYWIACAIAVGWMAGRGAGLRVGSMSGLTSGSVGLLVLGSKLRESPVEGAALAGSYKPNALLIVVGFLVASTFIGAIGGALGAIIYARPRNAVEPRCWLFRFAIVTAASMLPLLFIGGLVTSTGSGMAVPDWPNTFGTNMFLYPLGPRTSPDKFLEHSHRLFGTLAGLTVIVAAALVWKEESRAWVRKWAISLVPLVVFQGVLGGLRVLIGRLAVTEAAQDGTTLHFLRGIIGSDPARIQAIEKWMRVGHGILAQLVFAAAVALAAFLSRAYLEKYSQHSPGARRVRVFATAALHATFLQLVFGAMYRHTRSPHALWSHAGFSLIVVVAALLAGFAALTLPTTTSLFRSLKMLGRALLIVVSLQFLLGWVTFVFGGKKLDAADAVEAFVRSIHQFNGAILIALVAGVAALVRRIPKKTPTATGPT